MAQIKKEVKKALREYLTKVQRDIPVDFAILYGSQAKGQARPQRDIDREAVTSQTVSTTGCAGGTDLYAYGKKDSVTDKHSIYKELSKDESERRKKYREFVKGMLTEKDAMKGDMNRRVVYGRDDFVEEVTKQYKVGAVINPIGRPRKDEDRDN